MIGIGTYTYCTSRNWRLKVTGIKNPKDTNCRHLCPYRTLPVSKSSDHWCAFGTMANFEKRNLRSGHLMWPGRVTFVVIGSSFFFLEMCHIVGWTAMHIWRRYASSFFRSLRKTWGGSDKAVRGLRKNTKMYRVSHKFVFSCFCTFLGSIILPHVQNYLRNK